MATSLNDAYGNLLGGGAGSGVAGSGGTAILDVEENRIGQTAPNALVSAQTKVVENRKGQTSFQVDARDISVMDEQVMFFRVQEYRRSTASWLTVAGAVNNGLPIQGPILVVPPTDVLSGTAASAMTLFGKAPSNTGCAEGAIPVIDTTVQTPLPMHIVFAKPLSSLLVRNTDAAGDLLISYGVGQPMMLIAHGEDLQSGYGHGKPAINEIFLARASGDGGCSFALDYLMVHFII
jgi:hypothetical protein